jgi:hypothetical protein
VQIFASSALCATSLSTAAVRSKKHRLCKVFLSSVVVLRMFKTSSNSALTLLFTVAYGLTALSSTKFPKCQILEAFRNSAFCCPRNIFAVC